MESELKMIHIDFQRYYNDIFRLCKQIVDSKGSFDFVIGIARGGLPPSFFVSKALKVPIALMISKRYPDEASGQNAILKKPLFSKYLASLSKIEGQGILVDDLVDGGETLIYGIEYLQKEYPRIELKTAVLYKKVHAKIAPDFYVAELPAEWIMFFYDEEAFWTKV
jgi:hypoxanthine phosphoribosyltransferase